MPPARRQLILVFAAVCAVILFAYHRNDPSSSGDTRHSELATGASSGITPSSVVVSVAGFSHFKNLYLRNGTIFLLSPPGASPYDPNEGGGGGFKDVLGAELLPIKQITSTGVISTAPYEEREATANDITVLPWEDRALLDLDIQQPLRVKGTTIWINDDGGLFLDHYYHMWVELIFGAWRSLVMGGDQTEDRLGHTNVEDPTRIIFPNGDEDCWRDNARINGYLLKTIFPSLAFEFRTDFDERMQTGKTYVYDRVVVLDRTAGSAGSKSTGPKAWYWKMVADVLTAPVTPNWWMPIRQRLLETLPPVEQATAPTITYISRQGGGRSLRDADHTALVKGLEALVAKNGWILEIPQMQKMTKDEQFALAARTTVMLGVHGNELSHQIWMEPTPFSTVIEMFDQDAFCYDYALPAQALGHAHYISWLTGPVDTHKEVQKVSYTENFHTMEQRQSATMIVDLIERRLKGWKP